MLLYYYITILLSTLKFCQVASDLWELEKVQRLFFAKLGSVLPFGPLRLASWTPRGRLSCALGRLLDALGRSWTPLGRLLDALGRSWTPLGRLLDASWPLLALQTGLLERS